MIDPLKTVFAMLYISKTEITQVGVAFYNLNWLYQQLVITTYIIIHFNFW